MNDTRAEAANLLGAVALLAGGAAHGAVAASVGASGVLGEALVAIKDQPDRTADWLAQVLHISQPGAAHLVRKLTEQGWVCRGNQGRARPLRLTSAGEGAADAALAARAAVLEELVGRLSAAQRAQLIDIAGALLAPEARTEQLLAELCRLCDRGACPRCPVHNGLLNAT